MKKSAATKAKELGWGGVVDVNMTVHDVPFIDNQMEVISTDDEMDELRAGFDKWFNDQYGRFPGQLYVEST